MADKFTERENYILSNSIDIEWFLEAINKNNPLHPEEGAAHTESYELNGQNILVPRVRIKNGKAILNKENALEEALEKGDYIIVPEGEDPDQYSKDLSKLIGKFRGYAEGGKVNNMSMQKQMSLFEYGGIADDGMTKDPVSGNNIPPGSLAKEVRDDIPAMLSEGEYVVPADVLRYYGVNFFENLRNQAKSGLQNMEQNGRIGGTPMTQQDVARNMQQPVQAAQGAMMQSPMKIQQRPAPQAMGNSGMPMQGYSGEDGSVVTGDPRANEYRSGWSPARARWSSPMFQGTSSQAANVAAAAQAAEAEEITQFRTHYNQAGETAQVKYVGTTQENMRIAEGQDDLIAKYPLTEAEYNAYKKQMSRGSGGEGGGEDPTPTGSSTDWADGINWSDPASVKSWANQALKQDPLMEDLGQKGGLLFGGVAGISLGTAISQVRGAAELARQMGDEELAAYLEGEAEKSVRNGGILISALDKLGLLTGNNYAKSLSITRDPKVSAQDTQEDQQAAQKELLEYASLMNQPSSGGDDDDPPIVTGRSISQTRDILSNTEDLGDTTTNLDRTTSKVTDLVTGKNTSGQVGFDKGGLMTAPKPKKKTRKYNKGGLAGKKK